MRHFTEKNAFITGKLSASDQPLYFRNKSPTILFDFFVTGKLRQIVSC